MTGFVMRQHVTDPETCIQCSACEMACPTNAIENIVGRYCIDFERCNDCGVCIKECPTGAADSFVDVACAHSKDEQSSWVVLPLSDER